MRIDLADSRLAEHEELRASVLGALRDGAAVTRRAWQDPAAWRSLWEIAVGLEWPGLLASAAVGGSEAGVAELVVALEAVGSTLAPLPLLSTAAWAVPLLSRAPGSAARTALESITQRGLVCAVVDATGRLPVDGAVLIPAVVSAPVADVLVVRIGAALMVAHVGEDGVSVLGRASVDPALAVGDVRINQSLLTSPVDLDRLDVALAIGRTGAAAELVGVARRALATAVDHCSVRVQFDRPIATFQAVKHRLADLYVMIERAHSLANHAAMLLDADDAQGPATSHLAAGAAADAAIESARSNLRLHGAMGVTWEHDAHLILRRARYLVQALGGATEHYRRGAVAMTEVVS